jgi:hypothetical protein
MAGMSQGSSVHGVYHGASPTPILSLYPRITRRDYAGGPQQLYGRRMLEIEAQWVVLEVRERICAENTVDCIGLRGARSTRWDWEKHIQVVLFAVSV